MEAFINGIENMCIGELSSVLYRQFQIYMNRNMRAYGVNSSELMFLLKIGTEPVNQKQLSDSLCVDYAIATRSLQALEKKGLVTRTKSAADARATMVGLTERGAEIRQAGARTRQEWKKKVMDSVAGERSDYLLETVREMAKRAMYQTNMAKGDEGIGS